MIQKSILLLCAIFLALYASAEDAQRSLLEYVPAPPDNPLKGLVPYQGDHRSEFPHSLEFNYLPVSAVVVGLDKYDWKPLEALLDDIAGRGHHAIVRFFLEYPGKKEGIPSYLTDGGLKVHTYFDKDSKQEFRTPDYSDPNLRKMLKSFILEFGAKYDGDARMGFITAGLLGAWGEWHDYPREELYASKSVESEVLDAYEAAFKITPVLLRYPAGDGHSSHASNAERRFGYHDDSFAWATLDTGKKGDEWFYMRLLKSAGKAAQNKWKTFPVGGEIRPEAWGSVFDENPGRPEIQNFKKCVEETHVSWLLDSGMFVKTQNMERVRRAKVEVARMGYEFHIPAVSVAMTNEKIQLKIEFENRGTAPFYFPWRGEIGLIHANGSIVKMVQAKGQLNGLLPGEPARIWAEEVELKGVVPGQYKVALRVSNSLKSGNPIRFANKTQDADVKGWITLGAIEVK